MADREGPPLGRKSSGDLDLALDSEKYPEDFLTGGDELTVTDIHNLTGR